MLAIPGGSLAPLREDQAFAELEKLGLGSSSWRRAWAEREGGGGPPGEGRKPEYFGGEAPTVAATVAEILWFSPSRKPKGQGPSRKHKGKSNEQL